MKADVIVVGTGQAGVPLATRLAAAGRTVVIIERSAAGGTCVNYGCTPTKTLVASARAAHVARTSGRFGVRAGAVEVDFAAVMARKDAVVDRWRGGVEKHLAGAGERLSFVHGHARLVAPRTVEIDGDPARRYEGEVVVLDVGARSSLPRLPGLEDGAWLDSARALELGRLPEHLLVVGGGYIATELGQMFRRFGSKVSIVYPSEHLLPHEDADVAQPIEEVFRAEGITLHPGRRAVRVARADGGIALALAGGGELRGSHVLFATGRRPNTDDLGCAAGGVAVDAAGYVVVDDRYQTSAAGTYAVGDCTPGPQFTHVAWDDHRVLFDVLEGRPARPRSRRIVPYTVFTDPQVAGVGMSEREAQAAKLSVEVGAMPFGQIARAIETDETAGIVKVLVDPASDRIRGARVVGVDAGELIHVFAALMQADASARAIVDGEMVHPTFAEGLQSALMKIPRFALSSKA